MSIISDICHFVVMNFKVLASRSFRIRVHCCELPSSHPTVRWSSESCSYPVETCTRSPPLHPPFTCNYFYSLHYESNHRFYDEIIQYLVFCDLQVSLHMMSFRFNYVAAKDKIPLFFVTEFLSAIHIYHIFKTF